MERNEMKRNEMERNEMKICSLRNENPLENADFKFSVNNGRNNGAEGTSLSTAKATPTTRDRGTERNRRLESEAL